MAWVLLASEGGVMCQRLLDLSAIALARPAICISHGMLQALCSHVKCSLRYDDARSLLCPPADHLGPALSLVSIKTRRLPVQK